MKEYKGRIVAPKGRFAIVVSHFNELVTKSLLSGALEGFEKFGVSDKNLSVAWVPGAFEIPLIAKQFANSGQFDAVICLGAVIRGATAHFDYVASQSASGIANVALESNIPVIYTILTTDTIEQAIERAGTKCGNKGFEAAMAAIEMIDLLQQIRREIPSQRNYAPSFSAEDLSIKI